MKVVVMRHGEAEGFGGLIKSDSQRNLTVNGEAQAVNAGKILNRYFNVTKVIASDYNRASKTGLLVAQACNANFEEVPYINCSQTNLETVINTLESLATTMTEDETVVLVSHIPIVYQLCDLCTSHNDFVSFRPASFAVFDYSTKQALGNSSRDYLSFTE